MWTNLLSKGNTGNLYRYPSTYIFGGFNGTTYNTIQKYDLLSISNESETLATVSLDHSSKDLSNNAYIFGGYSGSYLNTIQKWTGSVRSTEAQTLSNNNRDMSVSKVGSNVYIYGGTISPGTYTNAIQKWTGSVRSTEAQTLSSNVTDNTSTNYIYAATEYAYIFGGNTGSYSNVIQWHYPGSFCGNRSEVLSSGLAGAAAAFISDLPNYMYIFGGYRSDTSDVSSVIQTYNHNVVATLSLTLTNAVQEHSVSVNLDKILIFGGMNISSTYFNTISKFNTISIVTEGFNLGNTSQGHSSSTI